MDFSYLGTLSEGHDKNRILQDLMEAHGSDVWNFAFSLTRQTVMADDIRQDVFLKAFRKLETFRGESSVKNWLLSITRHTAADYQRKAFLRRVTLVGFVRSQEQAPSAEASFWQEESMSEVWKAVLKLPVKLREVLVLYAHHQLAIAEIAGLLQLSESAVKVRLHRARKKVNAVFHEEEGDRDGKAWV
ncbi:RNA polymerase sigma factor [Paenibacillus koleovorans]|uniref:RNA polymerase sigma factor n=1 Tax=Paenibacillus koleovorans TaxID=121608 RepID=UPI001FE888EB|nr:sigma-70 family RNA polymerase sigma factor [Paenibacillus koleovorans]